MVSGGTRGWGKECYSMLRCDWEGGQFPLESPHEENPQDLVSGGQNGGEGWRGQRSFSSEKGYVGGRGQLLKFVVQMEAGEWLEW